MKIIVFSGTSEGREITEYLNSKKVNTIVSVATEYGSSIMKHMPYVNVNIGRLDRDEMISFIKGADVVIDATHPYADIVTKNIKSACNNIGVEYIRLKREDILRTDVITVNNVDEAVNLLNKTKGKIFVSTGSKELHKYISIENYKDRLVVRVLPVEESENKCKELELKNVIYKKGPFSYNENLEDFKSGNVSWLVTKSSGKEGGFDEKINAARALGINIIVIKRPAEDKGLTMPEVKKIIDQRLIENLKFPLFIDISGKNVLVVGGGKIAVRRINTLLRFGANIKVIAPEFDITKVDGSVEYIKKEFESEDIEDIKNIFMVIGATNDREVNHSIYKLCSIKNIPVSIADCREECSFYFPAVCINNNLSIGIVSDGNNHKLVKNTAHKIRRMLDNE
ncbi:MAG: precorrin-6A reductase [Clostridia bacterium]|nr:precorrin-6A reductase [Clostridia bacterium]